MSKFCINCGATLVDEAKFCSACGYKQQQVTTQTVAQPDCDKTQPIQENLTFAENNFDNSTVKTPKNKRAITDFIKLIILSSLSLVMFIMAFLPICKIETELYDEKISVPLNAIDNITYMFDSFYSETSEDLLDSDLYYQCEELGKELRDTLDEDGELTAEGNRIFTKYAKLTARVLSRSEDFETTPSIVINGILSLGYLIVCAITFIFAVIKLLANLGVLKTNRNLSSIYSLILVTLALAIALTALNVNTERLAKVGGGALTTLITFGVCFISIIILNFIGGAKYNTKNLVIRSISTIVAILVIPLTFSSAFSAKVTANFDNGDKRSVTTKFENTIYEQFFQINEENLEYIDKIKELNITAKKDLFESMTQIFESYTTREVKNGEANNSIANVVGTVFLSKTVNGVYTLFAFTTLFFICALLSATGLLIDNLKYFMTGKSDKISYMNNKIITLVFTAIAFILNTIFLRTTNNMLNFYLPSIKLSLTAGPIIMLLFAIVLACLPYKKEKISFIE